MPICTSFTQVELHHQFGCQQAGADVGQPQVKLEVILEFGVEVQVDIQVQVQPLAQLGMWVDGKKRNKCSTQLNLYSIKIQVSLNCILVLHDHHFINPAHPTYPSLPRDSP